MHSFSLPHGEARKPRSFRLIRIYEKRGIGFIYVDGVSLRAGLFPETWLSRNLSARGSQQGGF